MGDLKKDSLHGAGILFVYGCVVFTLTYLMLTTVDLLGQMQRENSLTNFLPYYGDTLPLPEGFIEFSITIDGNGDTEYSQEFESPFSSEPEENELQVLPEGMIFCKNKSPAPYGAGLIFWRSFR